MDEHKDIQKDDPISRFFDGYQVKTNPFGDNRSGERAYRRAERIVAGVHLITNHIEASEPIRESLRKESIVLLDRMMEMRSEMRVPQSETYIGIHASIRKLVSYVRMLAVAGFLSVQNASALIEALDDLSGFMQASQRSPLSDRLSLSREMFQDAKTVRDGLIRSVKDIKDNAKLKDISLIKDTSMVSVGESVNEVSFRKQAILEILSPGRELGIKDIAAHIPEYGEKTIQRELSQLVVMGKVLKTGFKRWSRYSRAS